MTRRESDPTKLPLLALWGILAALVTMAWFGPPHLPAAQAGQLGMVTAPAVVSRDLVAITGGTANVALVAASSTTQVFYGFCVRETAGAAAIINFRSGTAATAPVLFTLSLIANESRAEWFPAGLPGAAGIFVERVSGTTDVLAYTGAY